MSKEEAEQIATEKAEQRLVEAQEEAARAEEQAATEERRLAFHTSQEEAKTKYEDYDQVVLESDLPTNPVMDEYLRRSGPLAGELLYYLGTHAEDTRRIAALRTAAEVIEEMALIKTTLKGAPSRGPSVSVKPVTKAPAPVQPLGSVSAASPGDLRSLSISEFMKVRNEQERANTGRI